MSLYKSVKCHMGLSGLAGLLAALASIGILSYHGVAASGPRSTSLSSGTSAQPFWAKTEASLEAAGDKGYNDRPANVRAIMDQMYRNDGSYRTMSALFVDHGPGDPVGSLQVELQQPNGMRTAAYNNTTGSGTPSEIAVGEGSEVTLYSPKVNAYTVIGRVLNGKVADLSNLPLGVGQRMRNGTSLYGSTFAGTAPLLADMCIHPASLLTSRFFSDTDVAVVGQTTVQERPSWELEGHLISTEPEPGVLGDSWRMWVDKDSGIVLRIEYYSPTNLIGWVGLTELSIDGTGKATSQAATELASWSLPPGAQNVQDPVAYDRLARPQP